MTVATVSQHRALRERFAVEVADGEDAVLMLAVVLVIETIRARRRQGAAAASVGMLGPAIGDSGSGFDGSDHARSRRDVADLR